MLILNPFGLLPSEKSKQGLPIVYGWMVDYFYKGFEANNIPAGMKALEPYLSDPNCLTSKRMEIERRLKGMETLVPGTIASEIMMAEANGNLFVLSTFNPSTKYILYSFQIGTRKIGFNDLKIVC